MTQSKNTRKYRASRASSSPAQLSFGDIILDPQAHRLQALQKSRKCLSCSKSFASTGPGNRVCVKCKGLDAWISASSDFAIHAAF